MPSLEKDSLHNIKNDYVVALTIDATNFKIGKVKNLPFDGKAVVLFKPVTEQLPFWAQEYYAKTPVEAILNTAKVGYKLQREGAENYIDENIVTEFFPDPSIEDLSQGVDLIKTPEYIKARKKFVEEYTAKKEDEYWDNYDKKVEEIRQEICTYADNDKEYGWKHLEDKDGNVLKVPGRAFLHFAIARADYMNKTGDQEIILPEYNVIAPRGLKMMNDDPLHTDCWLGAGLPLDNAYDHDMWQNRLFFEKMFEVQSTYFEHDFNILNRADQTKIKGTIVNPYNYENFPKGERILVIPHLGVEFEVAALQCDAIICETGGKLAHLTTVGREMGIPIIRMENAVIAFAMPRKIEFDLMEGKINFPKEEEIEIVLEKGKKKKI
jgi:phosphohistidine swiveling domain-containing protein